MSNAPLDDSGRTLVNLVRTTHPWTAADNAAGFVLRYLAPMRRILIQSLGSPAEADEALRKLLSHLVSAGFGKHRRGRLRDFLIKGIRSAAMNRISAMPGADADAGAGAGAGAQQTSLDELTSDSKIWLAYWREGLLERAWRSLERQEHATPEMPFYSVLHCATAKPQSTPAMLVVQIASEFNLTLDEQAVQSTLITARGLFAQVLADEVAETLEAPSEDDVKEEIAILGLGKAFSGITVASNE